MSTQRGTGNTTGAANWSLHLQPGAGQAQNIPLEPGKEYILGRTRTADVHLEDEKASRRHCRLFFKDTELGVEDLGSANGTHLNDRPLESVQWLKDGDLLRIGRTTLRISGGVKVSVKSQEWWAESRTVIENVTAPPQKQRGQTDQMMSGSLKSIPLVDLLQLLSTSQKSGVLTLRTKDECGRFYLRDGQIVRALYNDRTAPQPAKTVHRLLRWKTGRFELAPLEQLPDGPEVTDPTSALLLEGVQLADELGELEDKLPAAGAKLVLQTPLPVRLRDLAPEELDLLQLVLEKETWLDVQDHFAGTYLEAARCLVSLLERKIIQPR
jgi:hypothetical protein